MSERWIVHCGESSQVLQLYPDECFDSMCTDPPAGIAFMNKKWDRDHGGRDQWIEWLAGILREAFRVLKPGAHALVWALPRTSHWTATAVENAGFEIRDVISHIQGAGFPKSLDVSKAIDAAAGAEREVVGHKGGRYNYEFSESSGAPMGQISPRENSPENMAASGNITAPATDAAKQASGFGTAIKPSHENWILARKPLIGTVAVNFIEHGTGGLNIDGCRVGVSGAADEAETKGKNRHGDFDSAPPVSISFGDESGRVRSSYTASGRWPPNTLFSHSAACADECADDCPIWELGRQSGELHARGNTSQETTGKESTLVYGAYARQVVPSNASDSGSAARFFPNFHPDPPEFPFLYSAKPSSAERDAGLDTFQVLGTEDTVGRDPDTAGTQSPGAGAGRGAGAPRYRCRVCNLHLGGGRAATKCTDGKSHVPYEYDRGGGRRNGHATVKGTELMRWLCRLITPPGGTVLDPFAGSGSTGIACVLEGFSFHGIELDPYHCDLARARIAHVAGGDWEPLTNKAQAEQPRQQKLFGGI